jgi:hypothetical protein
MKIGFIHAVSLHTVLASELYFGSAQFKPLQDINYPERGFTWFSSVTSRKCYASASNRPWLLPSTSFPIHYSPSFKMALNYFQTLHFT